MGDQKSPISPWEKRARFLTQILVLSGTLNVALLATFSFFLLKERKKEMLPEATTLTSFWENAERTNVETISNAEIVRKYSEFSYQELLQVLEDTQLVEDGYTKRDLALAVLVAFHHFNLERALGGTRLAQRQVLFSRSQQSEQIELYMFPDISEEQFQAIIRYSKTERWPFTSQGIYFEIKRALQEQPSLSAIDATLVETFYLSYEFLSVHTLLSRNEYTQSKEETLRLLCEGNWPILERFANAQKKLQDFSKDRVRLLLMEYLEAHSKTAAQLFLSHDVEFAVKRLPDELVLTLLEVNKEEDKTQNLAKALICSLRGDRIHRYAAMKLYSSVHEVLPQPYNHLATLKKFCPEVLRAAVPELMETPGISKQEEASMAQPVPAAPPRKAKKMYVVQEGDNLWKIAKRHRVKIDAIKKINHLESDKLRVGRQLEIPDPA